MGRRFAHASIVALAGMVGCGIDAVGTAPIDGGPFPTPTSTDAPGADAAGPGPTTDGGGGVDADATAPLATCKELPATWGLVAFVTGADPCPAGFEAGKTELRAGATTRADTCTCGCVVTAQPVCNRGSAGATYDNDNSGTCGSTSSHTWNPAANGGCSTDMWPGPYTTNHDWKFSTPVRAGGTCSASTVKHPDRLDFATTARACVPTAGCEGAPAVAAPVQRCVISDGDVQCPAGPFTKRTVFGKTFDVTCAIGTCDCGITGTCGSAKMTFYANNNCTGASFAIAANGTCQPSTATNFSAASYNYTAALTGGGCTTTGAGAATAQTISMATVCCE